LGAEFRDANACFARVNLSREFYGGWRKPSEPLSLILASNTSEVVKKGVSVQTHGYRLDHARVYR
jgi:hypothetical protein